MTRGAACLFLALLAGAAPAQDSTAQPEGGAPAPATTQASAAILDPIPAAEVDLAAFKWHKRPVIIFADSDEDPDFQEQLRLLQSDPAALAARDVVIITDTDPAARGAIRLKLRPRGFMLVVMDKEGRVALRKPFPWDVRELIRSIDKMR